VWHKSGVNTRFRPKGVPRPLDQTTLHELALRYVGKYATTRAKLRIYLERKLRERGWDGDRKPDLGALADRFSELGYIDDASYALGQSRSLSNRGYGKRRLAQKLRLAGVGDSDSEEANAHADGTAVDAALRFAERKRMGPFAGEAPDPQRREKWIATMVRAGHNFALARLISGLVPGAPIDAEELRDRAGMSKL
jgi:regulatory protein